MEIIPDKVFISLFSKIPEGKEKYIPITGDESLYEKLLTIGYYPMYVEDKNDAEKYTKMVYDGLSNGDNVRDFIFLPLMLEKSVSKEMASSFNDLSLRYDKQAYKLLPKGFNVAAIKNNAVLERCMNEYIEKAERTNEPKNTELELVSLSTIEAKKVEWIDRPYLPRGKIVLMAADPGTGKTYVSCKICSCISTGSPMPWEQTEDPFIEYEPGNVIYLTAEDGLADTIRPRFDECGADVEKIFVVAPTAEDRLCFDDDRLVPMIEKVNPRLVVIDPLQGFLNPDVDMNSMNNIRAAMHKIEAWAEKYNFTALIVCHLNKGNGMALQRINGSTDIVAVARSVLLMGKTESGQLFMAHEKSSLSEKGYTVLFDITPDRGGITFKGFSTLSYDAYNQIRQKANRTKPRVEEAKDFLQEQMKEGYAKANKLLELAKDNGISEASLNRAKRELGIISKRYGRRSESDCFWAYPNYEVPENAIKKSEAKQISLRDTNEMKSIRKI